MPFFNVLNHFCFVLFNINVHIFYCIENHILGRVFCWSLDWFKSASVTFSPTQYLGDLVVLFLVDHTMLSWLWNRNPTQSDFVVVDIHRFESNLLAIFDEFLILGKTMYLSFFVFFFFIFFLKVWALDNDNNSLCNLQ